jgi:7-carboxy-7-deazaguanine synthase
MSSLCDQGFNVSLETSGDVDCELVDQRVKKIIDVKTPDSGEAGKFNVNNLKFKYGKSEFKFVICTEQDFEWATHFSQVNNLFESNLVLFSPSHGKISPQWLAKKILSTKSPARLQLQIHKYIWSEHFRGV